MYDTRWPRPGPAMAAVAAVLGLVAGTILGLSSPGSAPQAQASAPVETTVASTATTLPEAFHTVILGSFDERAFADERLVEVRRRGVKDAAILSAEQWDLRTRWAVHSGMFRSEPEAQAHREQLRQLGITESYVRSVKRGD